MKRHLPRVLSSFRSSKRRSQQHQNAQVAILDNNDDDRIELLRSPADTDLILISPSPVNFQFRNKTKLDEIIQLTPVVYENLNKSLLDDVIFDYNNVVCNENFVDNVNCCGTADQNDSIKEQLFSNEVGKKSLCFLSLNDTSHYYSKFGECTLNNINQNSYTPNQSINFLQQNSMVWYYLFILLTESHFFLVLNTFCIIFKYLQYKIVDL